MKRLALLLGTLALAAAFHSRAQAQAIQNPLIVKRGDPGEQIPTAQVIYGTVEDCEDNVRFEFGMDFATTVPIWEAWVGVGSTNCADVNSRKKADATAQNPICKLLGTDREASAKPRIEVNARDMFSKDWNSRTCDEVRNQAYTVYLIPLEQETNLSANSASQAMQVGAYSTLKAIFTLYTLPPDPPDGLKGITGEERIGVKFNVIEGAQAKTRYRAYFDWGTDGPGECGSGVLEGESAGVAEPDAEADMDAGAETDAETEVDAEADAEAATDAAADAGVDAEADVDAGRNVASGRGTRPPDEGTPKVQSVTVTAGEAYLGDLTAKGIDIGDSVAVSVVTLDAAENESDLAKPICVQRVETSSFVDNCKDDPECKNGFSTCSLSPGQRSGGLLGLGALFALGAALVLRRRRHV